MNLFFFFFCFPLSLRMSQTRAELYIKQISSHMHRQLNTDTVQHSRV